MIKYKEFGSERIEEVYNIYKENQWESYLGNKEKLSIAFENSLFILGAFENDVLVGFVRCVGDGKYILYIQDLIIKLSYHRRGIGKNLMKQVFQKFPDIYQLLLITDRDDKIANAFYQSIGMVEKCNGYPVNHYFRKK